MGTRERRNKRGMEKSTCGGTIVVGAIPPYSFLLVLVRDFLCTNRLRHIVGDRFWQLPQETSPIVQGRNDRGAIVHNFGIRAVQCRLAPITVEA